MSTVAWLGWVGWLLSVLLAFRLRSRAYGVFRGVISGIVLLIFLALRPWVGPFSSLFDVGLVVVFIDGLVLIRPQLRPLSYRILVSWPAHYFVGATFLAFPWALVAAGGGEPRGLWFPYGLGALGLLESLTARRERLALRVGAVPMVETLRRATSEVGRGDGLGGETVGPRFRIAQLTDPHLGPFMSVARLERICARIVSSEPDLVFLTGDFLTMESQRRPGELIEGLRPLAALEGRVVACLGNHDHEALRLVREALATVGARLLVDELVVVLTAAGPVEILGFDFHFRNRKETMQRVCEAHPRSPGVPRFVLLHDPGAFRHLPEGQGDLVFSGHTHGGQVGLLRLGLRGTLVSLLTSIPDHGLWALGKNRLYVHRGTGHYGFPLRLGVPAEESLLDVRWVEPAQSL